MFRSERVLRIIRFEPVFLAFNPGGLSAKPYRTRVFFLHIFLPAHKKLIVLGHFSFQFELWFFLIWSWSIPVGASEIRCSTRAFAASKTAATDHSRHESAKCEQDSKSGSRASGSWVRIPPYPPRSRQQLVFPAAGVSFCTNQTAGQYQPRADAPSQTPLRLYTAGAARQTPFAIIYSGVQRDRPPLRLYTAEAMRLRAKNERSRCLPARSERMVSMFWSDFGSVSSGEEAVVLSGNI